MSKIKINKLVKAGLSRNMVSQLSERAMDVLIQKFILDEQTGTVTVPQKTDPTKIRDLASKGLNVTVANEVKEDEENPMNFEKGARTQDPHQVGPSTDDGFGDYGDGMDEGEMTEKKQKKNPWAICTATMGKKFGTTERSDWSKRQMKEYERCVMDVKKQIKENKNPLLPILENITRKQIETNLLPQMDKASLIEMVAKNQSIVKRPLYNSSKAKTKKMEKPVGSMFSITKEKFESDLKEMEKTEGKTRELSPNPGKTKIPDYLTFDQLNIKFKK